MWPVSLVACLQYSLANFLSLAQIEQMPLQELFKLKFSYLQCYCAIVAVNCLADSQQKGLGLLGGL
jgi:hypothetical protein